MPMTSITLIISNNFELTNIINICSYSYVWRRQQATLMLLLLIKHKNLPGRRHPIGSYRIQRIPTTPCGRLSQGKGTQQYPTNFDKILSGIVGFLRIEFGWKVVGYWEVSKSLVSYQIPNYSDILQLPSKSCSKESNNFRRVPLRSGGFPIGSNGIR